MPLRFAALGALVATAAVVFIVLPRWVEEQPPPVVEEAPAPPPEEQAPLHTAEELQALRTESDDLQARLLNQQAQLDRRSVPEWGGDEYESYLQLSRDGDDAYLADAYFDSVGAYRQALEVGEALLQRSVELIDAALRAAREALDAGNATVAAEQFALVLRIEPDNAGAQTGLLRAQQLPMPIGKPSRSTDTGRRPARRSNRSKRGSLRSDSTR